MSTGSYPPRLFNETPIDTLLLTQESRIFVLHRDTETTETYQTFDENFRLYLTKLPNNNVKKYVGSIFNKNIIYIGTASGPKTDVIFSRLLIPRDKLVGIVIDSKALDIDIMTGEADNIDDCIYASYFGAIRAGVLLNQNSIAKDVDLHQLLTHYIYLIMLRGLGQKNIYGAKQKEFVYITCIYMYYRHFLKYKHPQAISVIKKDYKAPFTYLDEFLPSLSDISRYNSIKDIPKALTELKIYSGNPNLATLELLSSKGIGNGYWSLISSLDQLIPMAIISIYPSNLYPKNTLTSVKIHEEVEKIMTKYIEKIRYQIESEFNRD